ncbi:unnamed protein product [Nyctereutes procyonoides]|uniref:(raccoon dog) hypothetical protein n=1 Tax=Nyctereutes procyonoides TaxID=34880 RepID=A0A811ZGC3_NYCPR|nr:unnamed protein product [Nyctereutes procyonoides]
MSTLRTPKIKRLTALRGLSQCRPAPRAGTDSTPRAGRTTSSSEPAPPANPPPRSTGAASAGEVHPQPRPNFALCGPKLSPARPRRAPHLGAGSKGARGGRSGVGGGGGARNPRPGAERVSELLAGPGAPAAPAEPPVSLQQRDERSRVGRRGHCGPRARRLAGTRPPALTGMRREDARAAGAVPGPPPPRSEARSPAPARARARRGSRRPGLGSGGD